MPRSRRSGDVVQARVLVAVGTDKHPFDRLIRWLVDWHRGVGEDVGLTVQHGHTRAPAVPGAVTFLSHDELQTAMAEADLVVCHAGPATILEARRQGHLPIVIPRDPARGEHVDDHQQLFARRLAAAGMVALAETREVVIEALTAGLANPIRFAVATDPEACEARRAAVEQVGRIVEDLVVASAGHRQRPRWRLWVRPDRNGERR
ncbi:glycosyltransferase [Micromonospora zamorensis]|uniref:glycosyltransferase n=1 Tax=Micromonospora zamorensis TaxID=709883 RepID=UPI0033A9E621